LESRYCDAVFSKTIKLVTTPYTFNTGRFRIDAALFRGPASYANDAINSKFENNSILKINKDSDLGLYASKNIYNGEEIFTSYGNLYWKGFHLPFETIHIN